MLLLLRSLASTLQRSDGALRRHHRHHECPGLVPSDFLKKRTCEVQAFLKAIQLYRQDSGHYEPWDMLIGSDVRVRFLPVSRRAANPPSLALDTNA